MIASYTRLRRYAQFQSDNPDTVVNGADLDGDYDRIKVVCDAIVAALADVRRDDGGVKNASIGADQLKAEVLTLLDGVTPRGAWGTLTSYAVCDLVRQSNVLYFALVAHTSGVFATDLADGKWMAISAATNGSSIANVPAGSIAATTVQDAIDELDTEKQPIDATLTALAAVTVAANKLIYATGADTFATTDLTAAARTVLAGSTVAAMMATLGALPKDGSVAMTGALVLSGSPTAAQHAATKQYVDSVASARSAAVRQTVMGGPVDGTTGLPNVLPSTSGSLTLSTQNVTAVVPLVVGAANGFGAAGAVDRVGYSATNLTWTGLTASRAAATPNFLYVLVNEDGTLTTGRTIVAPVYQWGGVPATTDGLFTFNIGEMKGYLGNGSTATQTHLVFVGEAATDGTGVISTVAYAYNGRYRSAPVTLSAWTISTKVTKSHNIGCRPDAPGLTLRCTSADQGYAVGQTIPLSNTFTSSGVGVYFPAALGVDKTAMSIVTSSAGAWLATNLTTGANSALDITKWEYEFFATRGW